MRGFLVIGLTLIAATSALASPLSRKNEATLIRKVEDALAHDRLRDPASAQFRGVHVAYHACPANFDCHKDPSPLWAVCGEVNAKNGYGGYVGFEPFVFTGSGTIYFEDDDIEYDVKGFC